METKPANPGQAAGWKERLEKSRLKDMVIITEVRWHLKNRWPVRADRLLAYIDAQARDCERLAAGLELAEPAQKS